MCGWDSVILQDTLDCMSSERKHVPSVQLPSHVLTPASSVSLDRLGQCSHTDSSEKS